MRFVLHDTYQITQWLCLYASHTQAAVDSCTSTSLLVFKGVDGCPSLETHRVLYSAPSVAIAVQVSNFCEWKHPGILADTMTCQFHEESTCLCKRRRLSSMDVHKCEHHQTIVERWNAVRSEFNKYVHQLETILFADLGRWRSAGYLIASSTHPSTTHNIGSEICIT